MVGLGQRPGADGLQAGERSQPPLTLLVGPELRDRPHAEAGGDREKRPEAGVAAVELLMDQARGDRAHLGHAGRAHTVADEPERLHRLDQRERELRALPVAADHRQHRLVDEIAGATPVLALGVGEFVVEAEEVGLERAPDPVIVSIAIGLAQRFSKRRQPLLTKRGEGLGHVVRLDGQDLAAVLQRDRRLQRRGVDVGLEDLLRQPDAERAIGGDLAGELERSVEQLVRLERRG